MMTVKKPRGRKRGEVTVDDVVAAAIDILDREGVDAATIRCAAEAGSAPWPPHCDRRDRGEAMNVDHPGAT